MNWVGQLIQKNIDPHDTVLDLGCGVMLDLLDIYPLYPKTQLNCKALTGVDIYEPYLQWLNQHYPNVKTVLCNIGVFPLPFADKSFDDVLLLGVIEHLPIFEKAELLLKECERVASKRVFVATPKKFHSPKAGLEQVEPYKSLGGMANSFQEHHLLFTAQYFVNRGYKLKQPSILNQFGKYRLDLKEIRENAIFSFKEVYKNR
jgi:SAM-dependent methyltransferase